MLAQGGFDPQGAEFSVAGTLPGDQVHADIAVAEDGGYLVWQDNHTDGDGAGISAVRLSSSATTIFEPFQVNSTSVGNQERPAIAGLTGGSHLIVWQGGPDEKEDIYGRIIDANGLFLNDTDLRINSHGTSGKLDPAVVGLSNGNAVVTWGSFAQDDTDNSVVAWRGLQGVYAQLVSAEGELLGGEFQVNQTTRLSQRTPVVTSFDNGTFLIVWVTEHISGFGQSQEVTGVDIMGRLFSSEDGAPLGDEFQINSTDHISANPSVVSTGGTSFTVAWGERDLTDNENSWDIVARHFSSANSASGGEQNTVNQNLYGDQFAPVIRGSGAEQLIVWTSLGQDGSREGVYARFMTGGNLVGDEFRVNTQTASLQSMPIVGSQNDTSTLVVWSSFVGGPGSVDLMAQRYSVSIPRPGIPIVSASSSYELFVGWPEIGGFDVAEYHLYVDSASEPVVTTDIFHKASGLNPGTAHSFRLAYKLADGRVSPLSDAAIGTTFGADLNFDGLPDDWQEMQFGADSSLWDGPLVDTDGDGVNNLNEFLAGTRATDSESVLKMAISKTNQGWQLSWNSVRGLIYKVEASGDFDGWSEVGSYRFSAGAFDSTFVDLADGMEYYRVIRIR